MDPSERIWITGSEFIGDKIIWDEASAEAWREHGHTVRGPYVLDPPPTRGAVDFYAVEKAVSVLEAVGDFEGAVAVRELIKASTSRGTIER